MTVLLTFVDASRKECGIGELLHLSGDAARDLSLNVAAELVPIEWLPRNDSDARHLPHDG